MPENIKLVRAEDGKGLSENDFTNGHKIKLDDARLIDSPISISGSTDLNTLIAPGYYSCPISTIAASLINSPTTIPFALQVERASGLVQRLTESTRDADSKNKTYVRGISSGVWSAWKEIATVQDTVKKDGDILIGPLITRNNSAANTTEVRKSVVLQITSVGYIRGYFSH